MRVVGELRYLNLPGSSPAEATLEALLAHPVDGFLLLVALDEPRVGAAAFRVEVANDAAGRLLGRPALETTWDPVAGFASEWREELADAWLAVLETGRAWRAEVPLAGPRPRWCRVDATPSHHRLVVRLEDITDRRREDEDLRRREAAFRALADEQAALHVEQAALAAEQAALQRVALAVAGEEREPSLVFGTVAEESARLLGADGGAVIRYADRRWQVAGGWSALALGAPGALAGSSRAGALDRLLRTGRPSRGALGLAAAPFRTAVAAPIRVGGDVWGALVVATAGDARLPAGSEERLERFADLVSLAIANADARARLANQAARDPLTGLLNQHAFLEQLRGELLRSRRHGHDLSLVMLDVDHLRRVNDTHGHEAGDQVLAEIGERLAGVVRDGEHVARVSGEEFAWLLPETDALAACLAAERARRAVAASPFGSAGRLTVSAGVADLAAASSPEDLFRGAGAALQRAKSRGRNQTCRFAEDHAEGAPMRRRPQRSQVLGGLRALARAVDAKDPSTQRHSERVAELAARLARTCGWSAERVAQLSEAALVHDVGKIGVPDAILFKVGGLTGQEYEQIKLHAALGATIASEVLSPEQVRWIRHHHERHDGRGYPDGLAGEAIPQGARLLALADAWDAMTIARHYSDPLAVDEAYELCQQLAGSQFAPDAAAALRELWEGEAVAAVEAGSAA